MQLKGMKKLGLIVLTAAVIVACGNKAKDAEQARLDSIARADSIAKVEAMRTDSIEKAAEAQAMVDSMAKAQATADSIAAAKAQKAGKPMPKTTKPATKPVSTTTATSEKPATVKTEPVVDNRPKKEEVVKPRTPAEAAEAAEKAKKDAI
jgi:poly(hydroxyalcanoate) granule associated protein